LKRIAILHYAVSPTIGGVESTIDHQARGLSALGYAARIVSGLGEPFHTPIETSIHPYFSSTHPDVLAVQSELVRGQVTPSFQALKATITTQLAEALAGADVCIAHNVPTLHKNLALTAALAQIAPHIGISLIAYCHDMAWTNSQYQPELHPGYPWDLLRQPWPGARYVTVSEPRRIELAGLLAVAPQSITVILPGVDPTTFLRWTSVTQGLVERLRLLEADGLLLLPARLTRRKNIELALAVLAAVRQQSRRDFRLIVTGPPGPHNPANRSYLDELLGQRRALGLEDYAHFLVAAGQNPAQPVLLDDASTADFFRLADALFFPSLQEGFGIPILEAGLSGIPVFCSRIPPFEHSGGADVNYFDPVSDPPEEIAAQILTVLEESPVYRLRRRVRQQSRWDAIIRDHLIPLFEEA
jgi:mannosylglucosylglycerate synthase